MKPTPFDSTSADSAYQLRTLQVKKGYDSRLFQNEVKLGGRDQGKLSLTEIAAVTKLSEKTIQEL